MKLRFLPTNPPRYISFENTAFNKQLWYIIEDGKRTSKDGLCSFGLVLVLWAADPPATVYDELNEEFVPLVLGA